MSDLYETDIARWSEEQAALLRRFVGLKRPDFVSFLSEMVDWENVAEEIEDVARSERREIANRLVVLCRHLLKWQFQPDQRSGSWRGSIVEARNGIARLKRDSPSLQSYPENVLPGAYADGRREAEAETGLTNLPVQCPWTIDEVLDPDFLPHA
jgi:hypothetical protein